MRQTLSKGAFAAAAATGILSLYGSPALADADASGVAKDSPGVLSGNSVQAPVHVPVNLCGNTVNGLAALNKAIGNSCKNTSHKSKHHDAGADASAVVKGSPGVGSGNNVQLPVDVPVNVCGNSVDGGALFNTAYGNDCENESSGGGGYGHDHGHDTPSTDEEKTPPVKEVPSRPDHETPDSTTPDTETSSTSQEEEVEEGPLPQLAETGSEALAAASAASAALIVGGVMMYRRGRTTSSR